MRICSAHFEMDCFYKGFKVLRKHSVPTLGLNRPTAELYRNPIRRTYIKCCVKLCKAPWKQLLNFPKDKMLLRKWCHNLQLDKEIKLESLRDWKICDRHFEQQCLNQFGLIRNMAVPTLKLGHRKKLFKNPTFVLKSNIKKEQLENDENIVNHIEDTVTANLKSDIKKETINQVSKEDERNVNIKIETPKKASQLSKNLKSLKALGKPKTLFIKKEQKTKTITKKYLNKKDQNIKVIKSEERNTNSQMDKEKETFITKDKEKDKILKKLNTEEELKPLIGPFKDEIPQKTTTHFSFNEIEKTEIKEALTCGQKNLEMNLQEDAYLENLLEILTDSPPENENLTKPLKPFKQESIHSESFSVSQQESSQYLPFNKKETPTFLIHEIKQEILDDPLHQEESDQKVEKYLIERHDYKPSDFNCLEEEKDKKIMIKSKYFMSCCVKSCKNYDNFQSEVTLFKLPNMRKLRDHWLENCKLNHRQYSANGLLKRLRVCINHFDKNCIKENNRLLFGAVPTLLLGSELDSIESLQKFSYLRCRVQSCQRSCQYDQINRIPFPQGELKTKWCLNMNIKEETITTDDWICHKHFERKALIDCRKAKPGMLPSFLLDSLTSKECSTSKKKCFGKAYESAARQLSKPLNNKEIKFKCLYPFCKEKCQVLYDWPEKAIYGIIWMVVKKLGKHADDINAWKKMLKSTLANKEFNENSEANSEKIIKLCDEHFYYLYKINEKVINDYGAFKEHKVLKHKVQVSFEFINSLEKIYIRQCAVPQCKTNQNLKTCKSLKLFSFPQGDMAKKWCHNIGIEYSSLSTKPLIKICELHFENFCLNRRNLLDWALPTLNLPLTKDPKEILQNYTDKIRSINEKCCIKTCPNAQSLETTTNIRLYKFPKDPYMLQKWLKNTNCEESFKESATRICGLHFQSSDIINKTTLKEHAIPKYYLDPFTNFINTSPVSSIIDEDIQVKQELDNSDEWCVPLQQQDSFTNENFALKTQTTENIFELKCKENDKEQDFSQLIEIKQEIIEIQEEEPQTSQFTINKFETPSPHDLQYSNANLNKNQPADFVITDIKSQIYLCCVQKCNNNSEMPGIRMFNEFPHDSEIFIKWCFNLKIDPRNYKENQYAICEQHFEPICFTDNGLLQVWSVPTLNLNLNENSFIHQNDIPDNIKASNDQCIVYGCINPLKPLYKFPYNADISLKWFSNLKLDYTDFRAQNYRICRRHFSPLCFQNNDENKLTSEAVPTQYLGHTDKIWHFSSVEEQQLQLDGIAGGLNNQDNSRGSSQGSLARIISPHDLEDHDSSYFEDFEEYYGQDE